MERMERFYRIDQMIQERSVVPIESFMDELEVSKATFKRDIEYMRDRFNAPIEWDRDAGGYRFGKQTSGGPRYQLPGLWFNPTEIYALLTMQHLLKGLEPGILAPHVKPLLARLNALMDTSAATLSEVEKRIRITRMAARVGKLQFFETAATATLKRNRMHVTFWSRHSNETTERTLSPQRLVFYRGNWYLDAYCHLREGIRSFAIDGLRAAKLLPDIAKSVPEEELDEFFAGSYGIFSGKAKDWAKLKFSPTTARWVAGEHWHSKQRGRFEPDGSYLLEVPFGDDRELVMDILKYGPDCRVEGPPELKKRVAEQARKTAALYAAKAA